MFKKNATSLPGVKRKSIWKDHASWHLLLLCIPALVAYIVFSYVPIAASITIPFKDYKFSRGILGSEWIGLDNFKFFVANGQVIRALRNTFLYGVWFMILDPVIRIFFALMLFEITSKKALKAYQTIMTFPNFMSMVIVGYVTYAILCPRGGLLNQILAVLGIEAIDAYMHAWPWPIILTIVTFWKGIGMGSMMYYASLVGIDPSLYEAAEIDGASRFQKMRYISIPHLIPMACIFLILSMDNLVNAGFDLYYVIPRDIGALYSTTDVLSTYIYRALTNGNYAQGAAVGMTQSVTGLILVVVANAVVKKISPENAMF